MLPGEPGARRQHWKSSARPADRTQACLEAEGPPRLKRTVPTASENVPGILQGVLKALDLGPPRMAGRHPPPLTGAQDLGLQTCSELLPPFKRSPFYDDVSPPS